MCIAPQGAQKEEITGVKEGAMQEQQPSAFHLHASHHLSCLSKLTVSWNSGSQPVGRDPFGDPTTLSQGSPIKYLIMIQ